jgi:hypothetical protein
VRFELAAAASRCTLNFETSRVRNRPEDEKICLSLRKYILKRDESLASVSFKMAGHLIHPFRAVESFLPASQLNQIFYIYDGNKPFIDAIYINKRSPKHEMFVIVFFHKTLPVGYLETT